MTSNLTYLNAQQREELLNELKGMPFKKARGRLNRIDRRGKLRYHRNSQASGEVHTMYVLETLGTKVTLVEKPLVDIDAQPGTYKPDYKLIDVIVEPLPDNQS